jgi:hypothetical protein
MKVYINIDKPDDSNSTFPKVMIESDILYGSITKTVRLNRSQLDPVHGGLVNLWETLFNKGRGSRTKLTFTDNRPALVMIEGLPIALERRKGRYFLNGKSESLTTICNALARVTFKAIRVKDSVTLMRTLSSTLQLPEDAKYCLENRLPFHFYDGFTKIDVRLNVQQISNKTLAVEISDGVWGELNISDITSFCNFFYRNRKTGKFQYMGVKRLYEFLIGSKPTDSQFYLMKEFLKQNRQQDIVEKRALELLSELDQQYDRLKLINNENGSPDCLFVKGKHYDWMITDNQFKSDIQMVSTYVFQPMQSKGLPDVWDWKGPICIDNMSKGSSLGDQFAGRAMALLNDNMTIQIVNTIKRYITSPPNTNRIDWNEMLRVRKQDI